MTFRVRHTRLISMGAILLVFTSTFFLNNCKKFEVARKIIVKTEGVSEITRNSCKVAGSLLDQGSTGATQHGFCWSLTPNPAEAVDCNSMGSKEDKGAFSTFIEDLTPGTEYHIWAYAEDGDERTYAEALTFTTHSPELPTVETGGTLNITSTSAQCIYNILSDGGAPVTERGLCWGIQAEPSVEGDHLGFGTGTGEYTGTMEGLAPATDYFVRAYAINSVGVAYGGQHTFATAPEISVPSVITHPIEDKNATAALVGGSISNDGGSEITQKGICWSQTPNPTLESNVLNAGGNPDPFEFTINGLTPNTLYYIKAFATNDIGTGFGDQQQFRSLPEKGSFTDARDGKVYQTVQIGEQIWMAENLNFGEMIDAEVVANEDGSVQKYCYDDSPVNCDMYGGLYSWTEVMQDQFDEGIQGACPDGWHVPSDGEWKILEMTLGMPIDEINGEEYRGSFEGGLLKETGLDFWNSPNVEASNETGFTALGAGIKDAENVFKSLKDVTGFWTASWIEPTSWFRGLENDIPQIVRSMAPGDAAMSVRCVKD